MRVKQIWAVLPLPSNLKLAYSRVTLNPPTTVFFVLALVQCILQIVLHVRLYSQHRYANQSLQGVALNSSIVTFPLVVQKGNGLLLCDDIPTLAGGLDKCIKAPLSTSASKRSLSATPHVSASGKWTNMTLVESTTHEQALVPKQCVDVLPWVFQSLRATNRDDLTFSLYQAWLFGLNLTAILNESIPHLIAALALLTLDVIGSAARIIATTRFRTDFDRIVVVGSCNGVNLFLGDSYFQSRHSMEIVVCILNGIAIVAFTGLSWRLIKTYGQRSFERVNKKPEMGRLYIVILTMCTCTQMAIFYMVASIGLFFDQLTLGPLRNLAQDKPLYLTIDIMLLVLVVPWMILGWTCGRMESKPRTLAFLAITIVFMAAWASMFTSPVYRLLIVTWGFFAMTSITAMILMVVTLLLALYSWFHLDVGLAEYLKAEEPLHPADQVRWSLAITSDPQKRAPLTSKGVPGPQVTWVRLPSPMIAKPSTITQEITRSDLTPSPPTKGSKGSHWATNGIASRLTRKPPAVSLEPGTSPSPLSPLKSPPGLPVTPILTSPNQASPSVPVSLRATEIEQIPLPPQAVARGLPTVPEAAAIDPIKHRITDDIVIPKNPRLDAPRVVGERLPPVIGVATRVRPSQRSWV